MSTKTPLGANYGWTVSSDHQYAPRDLEKNIHDPLALFAVLNDVELMKVEKVLGYPVILSIKVGKYNLHLRIYKKKDVIERPDRLPSKTLLKDTSTFMEFNDQGGLVIIEGDLRERAQGHIPAFYATRVLSPQRREQIAAMECQLTSIPMDKIGLPKPAKPLQEVGTLTDGFFSESPTLEPELKD